MLIVSVRGHIQTVQKIVLLTCITSANIRSTTHFHPVDVNKGRYSTDSYRIIDFLRLYVIFTVHNVEYCT